MLQYTLSGANATVVINGKMYAVAGGHANWPSVRQLILDYANGVISQEQAEDRLEPLVNIPGFIAQVTTGRVTIGGGQVRFDGEPVTGHIAERLLAMIAKGANPRPLMRLLDRLAQAPIAGVRDQFLRWLEKSNMPLTADGCFIAYKYVRRGDDGHGNEVTRDDHTFKIDNSVGALIPRLQPDAINTDRNQTCAESGYHFCSFNYLPSYGSSGYRDYSDRPVMVVKIAPEDVCSFPDNEEAKGRCLFYEVIAEIPGHEALNKREIEGGNLIYTGLYASDPSPFQPEGPYTPVAVPDIYGYGADVYDAADDHDDDEADGDEIDDDSEDESEDRDPELHSIGRDNEGTVVVSDEGLQDNPTPTKAKAASKKLGWKQRLASIVHDGLTLTPARLRRLVAKHGQREAARLTGLPRSSIQDNLDKDA